jgi:hypothetical protein
VKDLIGTPSVATGGVGRFCKPPTSMAAIANVSTWADDVRGARPQTAAWHFLDVPRGSQRTDVGASCPSDGCVTKAITDQLAVLKDSTADKAKRTEALMFIVHFVGDLHQPMHCADNNDRGGNCVPLTYFGTRPVLKPDAHHHEFEPNLHAVWDSGIIKNAKRSKTESAWATELDKRFAASIATWATEDVHLEDWAWESFQAAEKTAYGKLAKTIPVEKPHLDVAHCDEDNDIAGRMLALKITASSAYQSAAAPVVEKQLAKAGARLARILNDVWQ